MEGHKGTGPGMEHFRGKISRQGGDFMVLYIGFHGQAGQLHIGIFLGNPLCPLLSFCFQQRTEEFPAGVRPFSQEGSYPVPYPKRSFIGQETGSDRSAVPGTGHDPEGTEAAFGGAGA